MDFGRESGNDALAQQVIIDYRETDLTAEDRALCDFAVKLTLTPGVMNEADVKALRDHGFNDEQILIAVQVIAYFNYINRIADALDVEPEDWMTPSKEEWLARKGRGYCKAPRG